jgi:hypothetical protein
MTHWYMTNPSDVQPRSCALINQTLQPGEIVEITEEQAAQMLATEPTGFFVGYDEPEWEYFHAERTTHGRRP